jgi:hypothetical protein
VTVDDSPRRGSKDVQDFDNSGSSSSGSGFLGAVVIYADSVDDGKPEARYGRVYLLRDQDALFLGKSSVAPSQIETEEGSVIHANLHHLYPNTGGYQLISRHHAVVQMSSGGTTVITDLSMNGIWEEKTGRLWTKNPGSRSQSHIVSGNQTLYMAVDMSALEAQQYGTKSMFRVQILRLDGHDT